MSYIGNTATTQAFTPAVDYFSGNGSTTAFTLSRPVASVAQVEAVIDNVVQNPSSAYTVSSNTITFTSAPLSGTNNIYVRYTSPITQVIAPSAGTVGSSQLASLSTIPTTGGNITIPAVTGTMMVSGNMPAFSAYRGTSDQSITASTNTKVQLNIEEFDTANAFDSTTNYRFTPLVAGYYQISGQVEASGTAVTRSFCVIYKNGSIYKIGNDGVQTSAYKSVVSALVYLNGSTDYIELYGWINGTSPVFYNGSGAGCYLTGVLVRGA